MRKRILKITAGFVLVIFIGGGVFYLITWYGFRKGVGGVEFGVTFSTVMARQLGLEPRGVFDAIVDDLGASRVRIPVYWNDVEPEEGKFEFGDYDYFIKKAEGAGAKLIIAVGRKLPRWPECYEPGWAQSQKSKVKGQKLTKYIETVVERYKVSPAIEMWQVENEPFHVYGADCASGKISSEFVDLEIALIRGLDNHPVMLTDSGEQGFWSSSLSRADVLGISMYYQVWNDILHVVRFPLGPGFYALKAKLFSFFYPDKKIIVSELQAEPWGPSLLPGYDIALQKELMNIAQFKNNIFYARRTGFDTFYLWGTEWWYWLKEKQNDSSLWEEAKRTIEVEPR